MKANEAPQQYIPKSALVAEIERIKNICQGVANANEDKEFTHLYYCGKAEAYSEMTELIDTLEVKEVDIDKLCEFRKNICFAYLERRLNEGLSIVPKNDYVRGRTFELNNLLAFIKSLPNEPVSERFAFKAIPRLLEMIEPTDRAKEYIAKLADTLEVEGYSTDAKIVRESLKIMNGEKVPMATMDEEGFL